MTALRMGKLYSKDINKKRFLQFYLFYVNIKLLSKQKRLKYISFIKEGPDHLNISLVLFQSILSC